MLHRSCSWQVPQRIFQPRHGLLFSPRIRPRLFPRLAPPPHAGPRVVRLTLYGVQAVPRAVHVGPGQVVPRRVQRVQDHFVDVRLGGFVEFPRPGKRRSFGVEGVLSRYERVHVPVPWHQVRHVSRLAEFHVGEEGGYLGRLLHGEGLGAGTDRGGG